MNFSEEYARLNDAQKAAVDQIDGPLLVVAGPGTGKTQLLSARVAKILQDTDTLPQSILCLTFTEAAAQNIRERLASFIGQDAYDVSINTYHAFGSEIINTYPEYFVNNRLDRPIDDLGKRQILLDIVSVLDFDSTLKSTQYHIGDLMSTISELKRALHSPASLRRLSAKNISEIEELTPQIQNITEGIKQFPSSFAKAQPVYEQIAALFNDAERITDIKSLSYSAAQDLSLAFSEAEEQSKSTPLTKWKNRWLHKNSEGTFEFTDKKLSTKLSELADVLEAYDAKLKERGLFDFDDMILKSIEGIEGNPELKHNLQERYLYVLLDEFQDTNAAQFALVQHLSDNPVHEGRPNVMAVGDDDQAIYAFQGAQSSNMLDFASGFTDTTIVNLRENYRSHSEILDAAQNVSAQIDSRLEQSLSGVNKKLQPKANIESVTLSRNHFVGQSEEYAWIATQIKQLIDSGVAEEEIAVLAPKHRFLESLVPYLNDLKIPVAYEKRENILTTTIVSYLRQMAELVVAIEKNDKTVVNQLLPQILSFEFFEIPVQEIWQTNWSFGSSNTDSWAEHASKNKHIAPWVWMLHAIASQSATHTLEDILDALIGSRSIENPGSNETFISPLKKYFFSEDAKHKNPLLYYETLSHLSVIRQKLRQHEASEEDSLNLQSFLDFISLYEQAEQPLLNTHPIAQSDNSVQLLTAYKSKGLEFEHVFLVSSQDEVWGMRARSNTNKLTLPANLKHIRHAGANEDERLRLLFVAITRAKHGLIMTSHGSNEAGTKTTPLKFLAERSIDDQQIAEVFPKGKQQVHATEQTTRAAKEASIELGWHAPHLRMSPTLKNLLSERLESYQMSPTHLNTFIDMEYGGPEVFLLSTILRFPQAPGPDGEYGNAVHQTLQWYQYRVNRDERPSHQEAVEQFSEFLSRRYLSDSDRELYLKRGQDALSKYLIDRGEMFQPGDHSEESFRSEGVIVGEAHLSGLIDRLEVDPKNKVVRIADFKTGKPSAKWHSNTKLLKYKQQLYMYKLLVENSHTYKGYAVESARLEFVEPDPDGRIVDPLVLDIKDPEEQEIISLINAAWKAIKALDFPDTAQYGKTYSGSKKFIESLLG